MKPSLTKTTLFTCCFLLLLSTHKTLAQTKKLKRPSSTVGISSVDKFVRESFNIYDKVYMYDGYAASGKSLEDSDIDVLEQAIDNVTGLLDSAPNILSDLDGKSVLKQSKATLQINRSKKALKYSLKTAKDLLSGKRKKDKEEETDTTSSEESNNDTNNQQSVNTNDQGNSAPPPNISDNLEVYSKFDYVPGDKLLFFDDFVNDFIGDFPAKWNTNGSGEVVTIGGSTLRWLGILPGYNTYYVPDVPKLPEEYTIEFDLLTSGLDIKTSSTSILQIMLSDDANFGAGNNYIRANIPFCQYSAIGIRIQNYSNKGQVGSINNVVTADIRKAVLNKPHISIAVNKQRFRLWVNQKKYIDIPRGVPSGITSLKFEANNLKDGKERIFITNLKVAEGGVDLRRKLLSEGKISTNGILFDSGSANIQPQSMGIIRQISQVLQQDGNIKLKIVGHTDADGNDATNMELSKKRAAAVKDALVKVYKVVPDRLQAEGKGETQPVGDNSTTDGKAQNRRVEFIKV